MRIKITAILALLVALPACSFIDNHRLDIKQGNIIDKKMLSRVHTGMTRDEVSYTLGSPVKTSTFNADRWDYVYQKKTSYGEMSIQHIIVTFKDNKVSHIDGLVFDDDQDKD